MTFRHISSKYSQLPDGQQVTLSWQHYPAWQDVYDRGRSDPKATGSHSMISGEWGRVTQIQGNITY
jgi:hypothetical protein